MNKNEIRQAMLFIEGLTEVKNHREALNSKQEALHYLGNGDLVKALESVRSLMFLAGYADGVLEGTLSQRLGKDGYLSAVHDYGIAVVAAQTGRRWQDVLAESKDSRGRAVGKPTPARAAQFNRHVKILTDWGWVDPLKNRRRTGNKGPKPSNRLVESTLADDDG